MISVRSSSFEDSSEIIRFLNLAYKKWGDQTHWAWKYSKSPEFAFGNVFLAEYNGQMIGHRGILFRNANVSSNSVLTASLGDTAIHPDFQGYGVYKRLHQLTLDYCRDNDACLAISWNRKGSTTYENNLKTGFTSIELNSFIKILNYKKFLRNELKNFRLFNSDDLKRFNLSICLEIEGKLIPFFELDRPKMQHEVIIRLRNDAISYFLYFKTSKDRFKELKILKLILYNDIWIKFNSIEAFTKFLLFGGNLLVRIFDKNL